MSSRGQQPSRVRAELPAGHLSSRDLYIYRLGAFSLSWFSFAWAIVDTVKIGHLFGDSTAYWAAWHTPTIYLPQAVLDQPTFTYSPVAALAIWPFAQLPQAVFLCAWSFVGVCAYAWLLAPLPWIHRIPAMGAGVLFALNGNIEWLLAVISIVGLRCAALWLVAAFTKVTPMAGFAWFVVRGEWRQVAVSAVVGAALVVASALLLPGAWLTWVGRLVQFSGDQGVNYLAPSIPILPRLVVGLMVVAWGARTNRPWTLAAMLVITQPDLQPWAFGYLAALPRLSAPVRA